MTPIELESAFASLWNFAEPAASLIALQSAADQADGDERSIWLTQVARALGLVGDFTAAGATLDGLPDSENAHLRARVAIERGRILNSSGDPQQAAPLFELAEQEALAAGAEGLAIDAIHMQAIAASSPVDSMRLNRTALAQAEASADPNARRWRASLRNNMGWDLFDAGDFAAALSEFELALELRRAEGDPIRIAHAEEAVAEARKALDP